MPSNDVCNVSNAPPSETVIETPRQRCPISLFIRLPKPINVLLEFLVEHVRRGVRMHFRSVTVRPPQTRCLDTTTPVRGFVDQESCLKKLTIFNQCKRDKMWFNAKDEPLVLSTHARSMEFTCYPVHSRCARLDKRTFQILQYR